ncbi:MAG: hypothetical protein AAF645_30155, partial [Myxococcota bacterium]
ASTATSTSRQTSDVTNQRDELERLKAALISHGKAVADRALFHEVGIATFAPIAHREGEISVMEKPVFIYASEPSGWTLRVTPHGGPHWLKHADTVDAAVEATLAYQSHSRVLPGEGWVAEPD